jgi:F0F1-type ATP synthase assembly protein I
MTGKSPKNNSYLKYSQLAFQMAAAILISVFIGKALDDYRGGKSKLFTAIFSLFGVFAALYNLIRSIRKDR